MSDLFSEQLTGSADEGSVTEFTSQTLCDDVQNPNILPKAIETPLSPTFFNSAVDDLSSLVWKMSIGPGGQPSFTGPSGNFGMDDPEKPETVDRFHLVAAVDEELDLDDTGIRGHFLALFMEHVNPYYQFLGDLSMFSCPGSYPVAELSADFRTNAVLAVGACYASSDRAVALGQAYAGRAEELMLRCCRDNPDLALVQGLAILTWRELSLGRDHIAWMYNCESLAQSRVWGSRTANYSYSSDCWSSCAPRPPRYRASRTFRPNSTLIP